MVRKIDGLQAFCVIYCTEPVHVLWLSSRGCSLFAAVNVMPWALEFMNTIVQVRVRNGEEKRMWMERRRYRLKTSKEIQLYVFMFSEHVLFSK